jgi:YbbR domain-containing protein
MKLNQVLLAIVSLIIATMLWLQVQSQGEPFTQREIAVRLEIRNLPDHLIVTQAPATVSVVAEGTRDQLSRLDTSQIIAFTDLSEATSGMANYRVQLSAPTRLPVNLSVPRSVVKIEAVAIARAERPVDVEAFGKIRPGLVFDGATAQPDVVTLIGPETQVPLVQKVRALVDLAKLQPGVSMPVTLEVIGPENKPMRLVHADPSVVTVLPAVAVAPESKSVLVVPRWQGQPAFGYEVKGYEIRPNQLELTGKSDRLAQVLRVETEPINLANAKADLNIRVRAIVPKGLRIKGSQEVVARVTIGPVKPAPSPSTGQP